MLLKNIHGHYLNGVSMTLDEFKIRYPEFCNHSHIEKQRQDPLHLRSIVAYLIEWLGEEGIEWKRQPNANTTHHVFWFKTAKYATIFSLKWSN